MMAGSSSSGASPDDQGSFHSKLISYALTWTLGAVGGGVFLWRLNSERHKRKTLHKQSASMFGRVCVVTGANSGIGKATVQSLYNKGATVVMACRSIEKGNAAREEILATTGQQPMKSSSQNHGEIHVMQLDLTCFSSISNFVDEIKRKKLPLNVLINNAGVMKQKQEFSSGIETTLVTNHFGPAHLTSLLLPSMRMTAKLHGSQSRIVNVSSSLEKGAAPVAAIAAAAGGLRPLLPGGGGGGGGSGGEEGGHGHGHGDGRHDVWRAYRDSKRLHLLWCYELHRRQQQQCLAAGELRPLISVNNVSPGVVRTRLNREFPAVGRALLGLLGPLLPFLRSPARGAAGVVHAACAPELEGVSGRYFKDGLEVQSSQESQNKREAESAWKLTEAVFKKMESDGLNSSSKKDGKESKENISNKQQQQQY